MMNPYEHDDRDGLDGRDRERPAPHCRSCGSYDGPFNAFNGWSWCAATCYREIVALYMGQPQPVTVEDAQEHFAQRTGR
jgi:hypothetical protein